MFKGVVSYGMTFEPNSLHQLGLIQGVFAQAKEGASSSIMLELVQNEIGDIGYRAIVEGQKNLLTIRFYMPKRGRNQLLQRFDQKGIHLLLNSVEGEYLRQLIVEVIGDLAIGIAAAQLNHLLEELRVALNLG